MIIVTIKIEEVKTKDGKEVKVWTSGTNEGPATELEADYTEKLLTEISKAQKTVAESLGADTTEEQPLNIYKRRLKDYDL